MTIEFRKFVARPAVLEAIQVTAENVEELAVWMGADTYSVEKVLVGGDRKVIFSKFIVYKDQKQSRPHPIVYTSIGDYLVKYPAHVEYGFRDVDDKYFSATQADMDKFVTQQLDEGSIDPYSRAEDERG